MVVTVLVLWKHKITVLISHVSSFKHLALSYFVGVKTITAAMARWLKSGVTVWLMQCAPHMRCFHTGNYNTFKDVEFAFWCMFACEDFKELSKGPSGTEKKDASGKKKERKNVSVTLMSQTGMQHAAFFLMLCVSAALILCECMVLLSMAFACVPWTFLRKCHEWIHIVVYMSFTKHTLFSYFLEIILTIHSHLFVFGLLPCWNLHRPIFFTCIMVQITTRYLKGVNLPTLETMLNYYPILEFP